MPADLEEISPGLAVVVHPCLKAEMADREGFEPSLCSSEDVENQFSYERGESRSSPISSLSGGNDCPILAQIVADWPHLSGEIRLAILAIVRASGKGVEP